MPVKHAYGSMKSRRHVIGDRATWHPAAPVGDRSEPGVLAGPCGCSRAGGGQVTAEVFIAPAVRGAYIDPLLPVGQQPATAATLRK